MGKAVLDAVVLIDRDGTEISVPARRSRRARRMQLRVDPVRGGPELVLPAGVDGSDAATFARRHIGWLRARLERLPARVAFRDGAVLPVLGRDHVVRHRPDLRGGVWPAGEADGPCALIVTGPAAHLPRRLTDWFKTEARHQILPRARVHAETLARPLGRVTIRDTVSRWGSCSVRGDLSFSWRLMLAPEAVLGYVVAHEAAHLVEMNHSARFWRLVGQLMPGFEPHRAWLKHNGARLHAYG